MSVLSTDLTEIASRLCSAGKGILASDESPSTMGKRLVKAGKDNTPETRRQYRGLFYGAELGGAISGAILHPEALDMKLDDGRSFVEALHSQGIMVGVKVDEGLEPMEASCGAYEGETSTKGLETLEERLATYHEKGARFAKWRAAMPICKDEYRISRAAIEKNAAQLAAYAELCIAHGILPIVEPEILIDGDHDGGVYFVETRKVLGECMHALVQRGVRLDHILLKCQMVTPGVDWKGNGPWRDPATIARWTLDALRQTVPPAVKGIMFLSGGQTEYQSTVNLNELNVTARAFDEFAVPYRLSFSFGRGLQASVLDMWSRGESKEACMKKAEEVARVNGLAARGAFNEAVDGAHPTVLPKSGNLQESFRGVY
jgi:fructose-bisphosphate aldolase, class I